MATANPFFFERVKMKTSRKFATSPDILVAFREKTQSQMRLYWSQFQALHDVIIIMIVN